MFTEIKLLDRLGSPLVTVGYLRIASSETCRDFMISNALDSFVVTNKEPDEPACGGGKLTIAFAPIGGRHRAIEYADIANRCASQWSHRLMSGNLYHQLFCRTARICIDATDSDTLIEEHPGLYMLFINNVVTIARNPDNNCFSFKEGLKLLHFAMVLREISSMRQYFKRCLRDFYFSLIAHAARFPQTREDMHYLQRILVALVVDPSIPQCYATPSHVSYQDLLSFNQLVARYM